jgi:hypothetical protein
VDRACVEIVLHVTPDEDALGRWLDEMRAEQSLLYYDASLDIRIVTDPETLLSYAREERAYWYASVGNGQGNQLIESEHTTSSMGWDSNKAKSP